MKDFFQHSKSLGLALVLLTAGCAGGSKEIIAGGGPKIQLEPGREDASAARPPKNARGAKDSPEGSPAAAGGPIRKDWVNQKVSLNFQRAFLAEILDAVSRQVQVDFVLTENVRSRVASITLHHARLYDALEAILTSQGLAYEQVGDSNIFIVKPLNETRARVTTKVFPIHYIHLSGGGSSGGGSSVPKSGMTVVDKPGAADKGKGGGGGADSSSIVNVVQSVLSGNGRLQVDPYTNSLVVTDLPENFARVTEVINELDVLTPQVHIDAQILEVDANKAQTAGINWGNGKGIVAAMVGPARVVQWPTGLNSGQVFPTASDLAGSTGSFPVANYGTQTASGTSYGVIDLSTVTATLQLLQTEGAAKVLSQPSIMVLNNSPAVVSVTAETAIGNDVAVGIQSGTQATQAERSTTGLSLKVTPQVNDDEYITLLVELSNTQPVASKLPGYYDPTTALVTTKVRVRDGQTLIIGGLTTTNTQKTVSRVPILGSIPLLDMIFASTTESDVKEDLVLMITPKRAE